MSCLEAAFAQSAGQLPSHSNYVLALLDEKRSRQLMKRVIPAVTYTGTFEVIGRDDGLDPQT